MILQIKAECYHLMRIKYSLKPFSFLISGITRYLPTNSLVSWSFFPYVLPVHYLCSPRCVLLGIETIESQNLVFISAFIPLYISGLSSVVVYIVPSNLNKFTTSKIYIYNI